MIVTTQPVAGVLVVLRDAIRRQLEEQGLEGEEMKRHVRGCLERVSVSRVFDLEGLWEVLEDLDSAAEQKDKPRAADPVIAPLKDPSPEGIPLEAGPEASPELGETGRQKDEQASSRLLLPALRPARSEVADSEDEEELSSASSSPLSSPPASSPREVTASQAGETAVSQQGSPARPHPQPHPQQQPQAAPPSSNTQASESTLPDIIAITHFSALLTTLFTHHEKKSAHTSLQLLSSHLRYLSRNLPSDPLILILNSTASSTSSTTEAGNPHAGSAIVPRRSEKPLDHTLRSIFNPPPLAVPGYRHGAASRRNKPSFGLVFTQLLDMHLLCTRIPRDTEDAERLYAPQPASDGAEVRYVWAVEVLLDEVGVWETQDERKGAGGNKPPRSREQRWGVVDVVGGRVTNAFEPEPPRLYADIRLAAGFGGPRV